MMTKSEGPCEQLRLIAFECVFSLFQPRLQLLCECTLLAPLLHNVHVTEAAFRGTVNGANNEVSFAHLRPAHFGCTKARMCTRIMTPLH